MDNVEKMNSNTTLITISYECISMYIIKRDVMLTLQMFSYIFKITKSKAALSGIMRARPCKESTSKASFSATFLTRFVMVSQTP